MLKHIIFLSHFISLRAVQLSASCKKKGGMFGGDSNGREMKLMYVLITDDRADWPCLASKNNTSGWLSRARFEPQRNAGQSAAMSGLSQDSHALHKQGKWGNMFTPQYTQTPHKQYCHTE